MILKASGSSSGVWYCYCWRRFEAFGQYHLLVDWINEYLVLRERRQTFSDSSTVHTVPRVLPLFNNFPISVASLQGRGSHTSNPEAASLQSYLATFSYLLLHEICHECRNLKRYKFTYLQFWKHFSSKFTPAPPSPNPNIINQSHHLWPPYLLFWFSTYIECSNKLFIDSIVQKMRLTKRPETSAAVTVSFVAGRPTSLQYQIWYC